MRTKDSKHAILLISLPGTHGPNFQPEFKQKNKLRILISGKNLFDKTSKCREFGAVMLMYARLLKQQSKISKTSDNKRANAS